MTTATDLENWHDDYETRRIVSGLMLPTGRPLPTGYVRRPWAPAWISDDNETVIEWFVTWTHNAHHHEAFGDPLTLLLCMYETHTVERWGFGPDHRIPHLWKSSGNFVEYSGAHQIVTSDPAITARIGHAAHELAEVTTT